MARQVNSLAAQLAVGVSSFLKYFLFIQSSFAICNVCKGPFFSSASTSWAPFWISYLSLNVFVHSHHFIVLKSHCFGIAYTLACTQFLRAWCHKTCKMPFGHPNFKDKKNIFSNKNESMNFYQKSKWVSALARISTGPVVKWAAIFRFYVLHNQKHLRCYVYSDPICNSNTLLYCMPHTHSSQSEFLVGEQNA